MKFIIPFSFGVILMSLISCTVVGTLYPLSENENDFIFKKELIGKWGSLKDGSNFIEIDTVSGSSGKQYRAEFVSSQEENKNIIDTGWFLVRVIKINGQYFSDWQIDMQTELKPNKKDYSDLLITKHFFSIVKFEENDKIEIAFPDADELMKLIKSKRISLNYSMLKKDDYLILNKPKELQKALAESIRFSSLYKEGRISLQKLK